ncbi:hypothetical protein Bbelb_380000 [Branchiostoma belcheri]|nr:hypothetical protein Bbelb_380000 [Branchiostoma belcheri]
MEQVDCDGWGLEWSLQSASLGKCMETLRCPNNRAPLLAAPTWSKGTQGVTLGVGLAAGVVGRMPEFDRQPPNVHHSGFSVWVYSHSLSQGGYSRKAAETDCLPRLTSSVYPCYLPIAGGLVRGHQGVSTRRWAMRAARLGARPTPSSLQFSLGPYGKVPFATLAWGSAGKFAVDGFFSSLRVELMKAGQDVSVTLPILGFIRTPMVEKMYEKMEKGQEMLDMAAPMDQAALAIIRGGATRAREVYYPAMTRPLVILRAFFPNFVDSLLAD